QLVLHNVRRFYIIERNESQVHWKPGKKKLAELKKLMKDKKIVEKDFTDDDDEDENEDESEDEDYIESENEEESEDNEDNEDDEDEDDEESCESTKPIEKEDYKRKKEFMSLKFAFQDLVDRFKKMKEKQNYLNGRLTEENVAIAQTQSVQSNNLIDAHEK